ncbi:MAG: NrsF family protein [Alphaproteobacteria bacterium]
MPDTQDFISQLALNVKPTRLLPSPASLIWVLGAILLIYGVGMSWVLQWRGDLLAQLQRPFFIAELVVLFVAAIVNLVAAAYLCFPDQYQRSGFTKIALLLALAAPVIVLGQLFLPVDVRMILPVGEEVHKMECALCIAAVSALPSALLVGVLRRGASVKPNFSAFHSVIAATCVGCLSLRLAEANDSIPHLLLWHYVPTFLFAAIGGVLGKKLFAW